MTNVTPPPMARVPQGISDDLTHFLTATNRILLQLWQRTGGGSDNVENNPEIVSISLEIARIKADFDALRGDLSDIDCCTYATPLLEIEKRLESLERDISPVIASGGLEDAPIDGSQYGREDGAWTVISGGGGGSASWGTITGTLSNQTDLQSALDAKANTSHTHVEADITDLQSYLLNINSESIDELSDVIITTPATSAVLKYNGTNWVDDSVDYGELTGVPSTFTPASHTHVIADVTDFTDNSSNWDTAFGWGDHSLGGYLTSETSHADVVVDGDFTSNGLMSRTGAGTYSIVTDNSSNWNTAFGWGDHAGLYEAAFSKNTGFNLNLGSTAGTVCEGNDSRLSDARTPLAHTHVIADVTDFTDNSTNWNTAFGWGDHSTQNYAVTNANNNFSANQNATSFESDLFRGSTYESNSFIDFDDDESGLSGNTNNTTLACLGSMQFLCDSNNNGVGAFYWGEGDTTGLAATQLMSLSQTGNLTLIGTVDGRDIATDGTKLDGIESAATADQTDAEIETGYNNQVAQVSSGERTAGTETAIRRFSPADIASMAGTHGGGGGGGTTIDHFQVKDDGTTGQLTTGSAVDLAGMWATPDNTGTGFSWNGTTGVLSVTSASDVVEFDINIHSYNNLNNRHELHVQLLEDTGGGYSVIQEASSYTSRNNTQDEGQVTIGGWKIFNVAANTDYKVRIFDIGVAATVGASNVSGQSYISVKRYS